MVMPCRVVTTRAGTTAMPAFVRILAAVPTMGEVTGSFWGAVLTLGVRGCSHLAPISRERNTEYFKVKV